MKNSLLFTSLLALIFLVSCDDKPKPEDDFVPPEPVKGTVFVVNEGNFNSANASLTLLDVSNDKLYDDVFAPANNGRKLGDVFQSVSLFNNNAYLVVNNSQKIEVVNPVTFKSTAIINGFTSPRYMVQVDANKAYVSEYYANAVRVVDLSLNTIIGSIAIQGNLDEMVLKNKKVYITNTKRDYVVVISTLSDQVVDSIPTVYGSNSIKVDSAGYIWVLSNGDPVSGIRPALQRINPDIDSVDKKFSLDFSEVDVTRLRMNSSGTKLYWLSRHVYAHSIHANQVSSTPFIRSLGENYYGLGVHPYSGQLFISDAKDFVQRSSIRKYNANGGFAGEFKAGIIAGDFYFYFP